MSDNDTTLTVAEAAEILGCSRQVVHQRLRVLDVRVIRTEGKKRLQIPLTELVRLAAQGGFRGRGVTSEKAVAIREAQVIRISQAVKNLLPSIQGALNAEDPSERSELLSRVGAAISKATQEARETA